LRQERRHNEELRAAQYESAQEKEELLRQYEAQLEECRQQLEEEEQIKLALREQCD
jgi:hypothetical protein